MKKPKIAPWLVIMGVLVGFLADNNHGVLRAKWVRRMLQSLRIIVPLAVHNKTIGMLAGRQRDDDEPDAVFALDQVERAFFPLRKTAGQFDRFRKRRLQMKAP